MTELQFINAMSAQHHVAVIVNDLTDDLMACANRKHYLAREKAKMRQDTRAANRHERELKRAAALDTAVMTATVVGIAAATWFLSAIGAA